MHPRPSPLRLDVLAPYLSHHPDSCFAQYVAHGLTNGFHNGFSRSHSLRSATHNHPSSNERPMIIADQVQEELHLGRLTGPVPQSWFSDVQVSPIGLVPKPHSQLIVDLSFLPKATVSMMVSHHLAAHYNMRQLMRPWLSSLSWGTEPNL